MSKVKTEFSLNRDSINEPLIEKQSDKRLTQKSMREQTAAGIKA
jgi:hypothetical protein